LIVIYLIVIVISITKRRWFRIHLSSLLTSNKLFLASYLWSLKLAKENIVIVMKFGGASVADARAICQVTKIIDAYWHLGTVVVVSALAGVTNKLFALHAARQNREQLKIFDAVKELREQHIGVLSDLLGNVEDGASTARLSELLDELEQFAQSPFQMELERLQRDRLVSFGERLSAVLVATAVRHCGLEARDFDARGFIFTDDRHGAANVNFILTNLAAAAALRPYLEETGVPVVTGYIGSAPDGSVTTLDRGGSDYTATILGAALRADEVWLWKEEDGILTADPRLVPEARLLPELTYREAAEMSFHGAKVLHPLAIMPVRQLKIPIRVKNTFNPQSPGTIIKESAQDPASGIRVISIIRQLSTVTIEGLGMTGLTGIATEVTSLAKQAGVNIVMSMQAASEQNICLICQTTDSERLAQAIRVGLRERVNARLVDEIRVEDGLGAVAIVGEGMRGKKGVAGRVFSAVGAAGVNITGIVQGPSECNITFLTQEDTAEKAVRALHAAFGLDATDDLGKAEEKHE
jgi:aspartate kinase